MLEELVETERDRHHSRAEVFGDCRPLKSILQWRSVTRGVPVDENKLNGNSEGIGLLTETIDEGLDPTKQVPAVIVVTGSGYDGKVKATTRGMGESFHVGLDVRGGFPEALFSDRIVALKHRSQGVSV